MSEMVILPVEVSLSTWRHIPINLLECWFLEFKIWKKQNKICKINYMTPIDFEVWQEQTKIQASEE